LLIFDIDHSPPQPVDIGCFAVLFTLDSPSLSASLSRD